MKSSITRKGHERKLRKLAMSPPFSSTGVEEEEEEEEEGGVEVGVGVAGVGDGPGDIKSEKGNQLR